jgi:hypothetical protein
LTCFTYYFFTFGTLAATFGSQKEMRPTTHTFAFGNGGTKDNGIVTEVVINGKLFQVLW